MKKFLLLLICTVLFLSAAGCAMGGEPQKEQATPSKSETNTQKTQTFGLNESAVFSDLKFTATELTQSEGKDFFVPEKGNVFVGVKFTIENISDKEQSISSLLLFEPYVDDVKANLSISANCAFDEGTLDGSIAPGKKLVGWYAIEVPENWKTIEMDVQADLWSNKSATFVFHNK
ncbi:MAG: DUF4352 domain-containing protein [Oscillospiraceae bacterium]|nr:DUF4352 domain-containing protein [Oscillospiraceae bacterium]